MAFTTSTTPPKMGRTKINGPTLKKIYNQGLRDAMLPFPRKDQEKECLQAMKDYIDNLKLRNGYPAGVDYKASTITAGKGLLPEGHHGKHVNYKAVNEQKSEKQTANKVRKSIGRPGQKTYFEFDKDAILTPVIRKVFDSVLSDPEDPRQNKDQVLTVWLANFGRRQSILRDLHKNAATFHEDGSMTLSFIRKERVKKPHRVPAVLKYTPEENEAIFEWLKKAYTVELGFDKDAGEINDTDAIELKEFRERAMTNIEGRVSTQVQKLFPTLAAAWNAHFALVVVGDAKFSPHCLRATYCAATFANNREAILYSDHIQKVLCHVGAESSKHYEKCIHKEGHDLSLSAPPQLLDKTDELERTRQLLSIIEVDEVFGAAFIHKMRTAINDNIGRLEKRAEKEKKQNQKGKGKEKQQKRKANELDTENSSGSESDDAFVNGSSSSGVQKKRKIEVNVEDTETERENSGGETEIQEDSDSSDEDA